LDEKNYNQDILAEFLGEDFKLLEYFDHTYYMPSGKPSTGISGSFLSGGYQCDRNEQNAT
jgi:hypothetical protein